MQKNWIGRSQGIEMRFDVEGGEPIHVYTTRPDTLMGVTYVAVASEHPVALQAAERSSDVAAFVDSCRQSNVTEAAMEKKWRARACLFSGP